MRLPGPGLSQPRLSEAGARPLSVDCEDSRGGGCPWPVLVSLIVQLLKERAGDFRPIALLAMVLR